MYDDHVDICDGGRYQSPLSVGSNLSVSRFFFLSATAEYVRMVSVMRPGTVTVMMVGPLYAQSCC